MLWIITIVLAGLALAAWLKPDWFKNVYETTLAWIAVGAAGVLPILWDLISYLSTDTTWADVVGETYRPVALVVIAFLGIILRRLNVGKK